MKKMLKYQIIDLSKSFGVYFCVIIALTIAGISFSLSVTSSDININFNGTGFSSVILTFVMGICIYKEHYLMALQNGISRKSFYKSSLCVISLFCLICSIFDTLFVITAEFFIERFSSSFQILNILQLIYLDFFNGKGTFTMLFTNLLFTFTITIMSAALGLLISAVFCRIPKKYRTMYVIALPIFCCSILPMSFVWFPDFCSRASDVFFAILGLKDGAINPFIGCLSMSATFIILSICTYLLLRKTEI